MNLHNLLTVAITATSLTVIADGSTYQRRGTDILHYAVKQPMAVATDMAAVYPDANGRVFIRYHDQGKVTVQTMDITVRKLAVSAQYKLIIPAEEAGPLAPVEALALVEPAEPPEEIVLAVFSTDRRGNAMVRFRDVAHDSGKVVSLGRGKLPLPASINPLTRVKKLAVVDLQGLAVLTVDVSEPEQLSYLVKRDLSSETFRASLHVTANMRAAWVRVYANRLTPSADYQLVLNHTPSDPVEMFTTDALGRLVIRSQMENPLDILDVHSLKLLDADNNVVFGTGLPLP